MLRDIALYETIREDWERTEAQLRLEREALATRQRPALGDSALGVVVGRMARLLRGERKPAPARTPRTPTHRAPLAS